MQDSVTTWVITVLSILMRWKKLSKALYFKAIRYFSQFSVIHNTYKQVRATRRPRDADRSKFGTSAPGKGYLCPMGGLPPLAPCRQRLALGFQHFFQRKVLGVVHRAAAGAAILAGVRRIFHHRRHRQVGLVV